MPTEQTEQQRINAYRDAGLGAPPVVSATSLTPQTPITLPPKPTPTPIDTASGQAILDSTSASLAEIQKNLDANIEADKKKAEVTQTPDTGFLASLKEQLGLIPKQESTADLYSQTYGITPEQARLDKETALADTNAKRQALNASKAKFQGIQARLAGITAEAEAAALKSEDRQAPMFAIRGEQAQIQRQAAIKSLPLQAEGLMAQAEMAQNSGELELAQSILQQAQGRMDSFFQARMQDSQNDYSYRLRVFDEVMKFADKREQRLLDEKKTELSNNRTDYTNFISDVRSLASAATSNGQATVARQLSDIVANLNPSSKTFREDYQNALRTFSSLQGQIVKEEKINGSLNGNIAGIMSPYQTERSFRTLQSVNELSIKAKNSPGIFGRTAAIPLPDFLRSDAFRNFESELSTLKASIAFSELTAMREASKTGGALGQISNIELGLLESALGALNMRQSPENFQIQLKKIEGSIRRWQAAVSSAGGIQTTSSNELIPITAPTGEQIIITD